MKLQADLDGKTHDIEIRRDGEKVIARVDRIEYELEASEPEPGVFLIKSGPQIFDTFVERPSTPSEPTHVTVGQSAFDIKLIDPKRLRGSAIDDAHAAGIIEIKTAMPGKVVRILVSAGDSVAKGDGILVVEAMKMQNELRSPKDGVVKELRAAEGATVNAGQVLAIIE
jgi:biotin carboxyl carrier protein